jgi:hypothetical protein
MSKGHPPSLYKTIFQVRYESQLRYVQQISPAAQQMTEYPDWETDGVRVTLRDRDKHCSVAIAPDSFSYEQDSGDASLEKERIQRLLDVIPSSMGVDSATRIGYRQWFMLAVDMPLDSLVSVLNVKLLSSDEGLRQVLPQTISDLMYRVDASDDGHKYHITVGPVQKNEIPRWLPFNRGHHLRPGTAGGEFRKIVDAYPDVAVLMDIDMYREAEVLPMTEASSFVDQCRGTLSQMADSLGRYLFAVDLGG